MAHSVLQLSEYACVCCCHNAPPPPKQVSMSVPLNTTQYWDVINLTPDAVPVHLHNTAFRVSMEGGGGSSSSSKVPPAVSCVSQVCMCIESCRLTSFPGCRRES
jgi:hypothetical protein